MKRLAVLSVIVCMVTVAVLCFVRNEKTKFSRCVLSNVEALAQNPNESSSGETWQIGHVTKTIVQTEPSNDFNLNVSGGYGPVGAGGGYTHTGGSTVTTTTVEYDCCRRQGNLDSCSFELCPDED